MAGSKPKKDDAIEERIENEVVVDAHDEHERYSGWWNYLADEMAFPFAAEALAAGKKTPFKQGEKVKVVDMGSMEDEPAPITVEVEWESRQVEVPLAALKPIDADAPTAQAIGDWHYWVAHSYSY